MEVCVRVFLYKVKESETTYRFVLMITVQQRDSFFIKIINSCSLLSSSVMHIAVSECTQFLVMSGGAFRLKIQITPFIQYKFVKGFCIDDPKKRHYVNA
jgi:hypothetical protein